MHSLGHFKLKTVMIVESRKKVSYLHLPFEFRTHSFSLISLYKVAKFGTASTWKDYRLMVVLYLLMFDNLLSTSYSSLGNKSLGTKVLQGTNIQEQKSRDQKSGERKSFSPFNELTHASILIPIQFDSFYLFYRYVVQRDMVWSDFGT